MVNGALSIGGIVGVLLSGAFVYWEVGRFAAPQVPVSLFDERKEVFAYTAGLFAGVPIAFFLLLLTSAIANFATLAALIDIAILVGVTELAQALVLRSHYFGRSEATPFYALGFRAAVAGILILAAIAAYLGSATLGVGGVAVVAVESFALLMIQVTGALQSIPKSPTTPTASGGIFSGGVVGFAAFAVLAFGLALGVETGLAAGLLVIGGLLPAYRRLRRRILSPVSPATGAAADGTARTESRPFGRTGP